MIPSAKQLNIISSINSLQGDIYSHIICSQDRHGQKTTAGKRTEAAIKTLFRKKPVHKQPSRHPKTLENFRTKGKALINIRQ